jgi:hypothetical protein
MFYPVLRMHILFIYLNFLFYYFNYKKYFIIFYRLVIGHSSHKIILAFLISSDSFDCSLILQVELNLNSNGILRRE